MKPSRIPFCVGIMLLAACSPPKRAVPEEGNRVAERVEQAASLHTSITSLTPWDDIKESLKPAFKLDAADALTKSIPTTLVRLDRALDLLRFQLALTPTIVKQSGITTTTGGTGKETSTTEESKKETQSPDLPNVAPPSGLTSPTTSIQTAPDSPADSALQYQAAANLLRDVAVLNAEIENVARRTGHDAFLARFQVSVMPLSRGAWL